MAMDMSTLETTEEELETAYADLVTKEDIEDEIFPLSPMVLDRHQKRDKVLLQKVKKNSDYGKVTVEGVELIAKHGKVMVPESLQSGVMDSFHKLLQHPGMTRREDTIHNVAIGQSLREMVEVHYHNCPTCQKTKKQRKKYRHLPAKQAETTP